MITSGKLIICPSCNGSGKKPCSNCHGRGYSTLNDIDSCLFCDGSRQSTLNCRNCNGSGKVKKK